MSNISTNWEGVGIRGAGARDRKVVLFWVVLLLGSALLGGCTTEKVQRTKSGVRFVEKKSPVDGSLYMAMPQYSVPDYSDIAPCIILLDFLSVPQDRIEAELVRQLGTHIAIEHKQDIGSYTATPEQPVGKVKSVVVEYHRERVVGMVIRFQPQARDWGEALAILGVKPSNTPPTIDTIWAAAWLKEFPSIEYMQASHDDTGTPAVSRVWMTPNTALFSEYLSSPIAAADQPQGLPE